MEYNWLSIFQKGGLIGFKKYCQDYKPSSYIEFTIKYLEENDAILYRFTKPYVWSYKRIIPQEILQKDDIELLGRHLTYTVLEKYHNVVSIQKAINEGK